MRRVFSIEEKKEVRLWNRYMSNTYEHLSKMDNTLQDAGLYQGQVSGHFHFRVSRKGGRGFLMSDAPPHPPLSGISGLSI